MTKAFEKGLLVVRQAKLLPTEGAATGLEGMRCKVVTADDWPDHIECVAWDGATQGAVVKVAKPRALRRSLWDGVADPTNGLYTYKYTGTSKRNLMNGDIVVEKHEIVEPYVTAGELFAIRGWIGGTGCDVAEMESRRYGTLTIRGGDDNGTVTLDTTTLANMPVEIKCHVIWGSANPQGPGQRYQMNAVVTFETDPPNPVTKVAIQGGHGDALPSVNIPLWVEFLTAKLEWLEYNGGDRPRQFAKVPD